MVQSNLFVITGAEGSGKTRVIRDLQKIMPFYLINYLSTRNIGEDNYKVLDWDKYKELAENDAFILSFHKKSALVGVTYEEMENAKKSGLPIIWEVDIQWIETIKNEFPDCVTFLTNGLNVDEFYNRFEQKGNVVPSAIAYLAKKSENLHTSWRSFVDHIIENTRDQSQKAAEEIKRIIENG